MDPPGVIIMVCSKNVEATIMGIKKKISGLVDLVKKERPQNFLEDWERINLSAHDSERPKSSADADKASEERKVR
jgi:hypothetical protein